MLDREEDDVPLGVRQTKNQDLGQEAVRPGETGVATGMNTVMRTVGGVIGGQMGAALLTAYTVGHTAFPSVTGYDAAFAASAVGALIGAGVAVFVTPPPRLRRARIAVEPQIAE